MKVTAAEHFAIIPESVLYADISASSIRVYAVLRRFADKDSSAFPSHNTLAEKARMSSATVRRCLDELERVHAIRRSKRVDDEGRQTSNRYHILSTPLLTHEQDGVLTSEQGEVLTSEQRTIATRNESQRNERKTREIEHSDRFDEFWMSYPKAGRTEKPRARAKFKAALGRADVGAIIRGAQRYAADPNRDDAYTKHAATWLQNDCWEDPPLPARNGKARVSDVGRTLAQAEELRRAGL